MADNKTTSPGNPSTFKEATPSANMQQITGTPGLGLEGMASALMQPVVSATVAKGMPSASMAAVPAPAPAPTPAPAPSDPKK